MAGDWIKYELATSDKPEVWAIAHRLNIDPDAVVGKLLRVWGWFDQHTEKGNAPIVTKKLLDRVVCVNGFCDAMQNEGWLDSDGEMISLPNFDRHNGKTAKNRLLTAKRVANHKAKTNANGNDCTVSGALPREDVDVDIKNKTPHTPQGGREEFESELACKQMSGPGDGQASSAGTGRKRSTVALKTWVEQCKKSGEVPIPENDPVFEYASQVGIETDWLHLCWQEFCERYADGAKKYTDWRKVFRNCVRSNWYKLWTVDANGQMKLAPQGVMTQRRFRGAA